MGSPLPVSLGSAALALWLAFEVVLRPHRDESRSLRTGGEDRGSTYLLVAAYLIALSAPTLLPPVAPLPEAVRWAGVAVAALGLAVRAWAMLTLGASYTRTLRTEGGQSLVTSGPYRMVRHPGYTGSLAVWVGYAATRGEGVILLGVALLLVGAYAWRIRAEEAMLAARFGAEYSDYAAHRKRLIPGLY